MHYVAIKKVISIIFLSFIFVNDAAAGLPGIDTPWLSARIMDTLEEQAQAKGREALTKATTNLEQMLTGQMADNRNNAQANNIVRKGRMDQAVQNKSMLEEMSPKAGVCSDVGISLGVKEMACSQENAVSASGSENDDTIDDIVTLDNRGAVSDTFSDMVQNINETNPQLFTPDSNSSGDSSQSNNSGGDGSSESSESSGSSNSEDAVTVEPGNPLDATPYSSSSKGYMNLDGDQYDSMLKMVDLIALDPAYKKTGNLQEPIEDRSKEDRVKIMQSRSFFDVAKKSLVHPLTLRSQKGALKAETRQDRGQDTSSETVENGDLSYMMGYQMYVDEAVNSETIVKISTGDYSTPTRLYRTMTLHKAKMLSISLDQFKNSLRHEQLLATLLSRKIGD